MAAVVRRTETQLYKYILYFWMVAFQERILKFEDIFATVSALFDIIDQFRMSNINKSDDIVFGNGIIVRTKIPQMKIGLIALCYLLTFMECHNSAFQLISLSLQLISSTRGSLANDL
ncbi:hypothetical protein RF11_03363 [Thelohanellus kitauei]|uniref:Uncharacterized protein n=1 Tax=Thelohanellus kitauei TaxID=669202 RepID=A0A0C2NC86_THEKT|nr:hypothetical protein RF11_03363 [Thelohanellus kitauei]